MTANLPRPACVYGYCHDQLREILGDRLDAFADWMRGQTVALCDGRRYNGETGQYEAYCEDAHGVVTYASDLRNFLAGGPILD